MEEQVGSRETLSGRSFNGTSKSHAHLKDTFYCHFQQEVADLQDQIDKLERTALVGGERQDAIDYCLASISRLTAEVHDALDFIPTYDQRAYTASINNLTDKFQEARAKFAPKSRFAFQIKKNESALSLQDVASFAAAMTERKPGSESYCSESDTSGLSKSATNVIQLPSKDYNAEISEKTGRIRAPSFRQANSVSISEHVGLHMILPSSATHATSSGSLTDLSKCIVDMSISTVNGKPFAGLALKDITNSLVVAGQVSGAAHITNVRDSIVVVSSRQEVPSDKPMENHWDQIDDFKWLKAEKSPNWSVLAEAERLPEEIWTTIVPGSLECRLRISSSRLELASSWKIGCYGETGRHEAHF